MGVRVTVTGPGRTRRYEIDTPALNEGTRTQTTVDRSVVSEVYLTRALKRLGTQILDLSLGLNQISAANINKLDKVMVDVQLALDRVKTAMKRTSAKTTKKNWAKVLNRLAKAEGCLYEAKEIITDDMRGT